jgi:hypothetical protein
MAMVRMRAVGGRRLRVLGSVLVTAIATVAAASFTALGAAPASAASSPTGTSSTTTTSTQTQDSLKALVANAVAAANAHQSVHYVQSAKAGSQSVSVVGDVSATQGDQRVTVRNGSSVGHIEGRLASGNVYFRGDAYALASYLGMPTALAQKYKNRWIVFTKSDRGFTQTAKEFTLQGPLSVVSLTGTLSAGPTTMVNRAPVISVKGSTTALSSTGNSGAATLYLASTGSPLPVRFVGTGKQSAGSAKGQLDFSKWGETVVVVTPTKALAASKLS